MDYGYTKVDAQQLDDQDPLREYKDYFFIPKHEGNESIYLNGNSLGLQVKTTKTHLQQELEDWKNYGVEGHFMGKTPWVSFHERLGIHMAKIVGANPLEVVIMNTLTINLHLMMVSFYRPNSKRFKILAEYSPFPSDSYALKSQIKFHGFNPDEALIYLEPDNGELVSSQRIKEVIEQQGDEIALILIGGVNYYTGQVYPMEHIIKWGHEKGCIVGLDLAHAAGNIPLNLHDWNVDFAVWCTYKYLNSGPGSIGGCFVHEKYAKDTSLNRFAGWWGHDKETRFLMDDTFIPIDGAEGWQLSNPPILSLAAIQASLELFEKIGMKKLREKSVKLTGYLIYLIDHYLSDKLTIITPREPIHRGCQLSLVLKEGRKKVHTKLLSHGVYCDWREPNVIRIAPVPLYNSYDDVFRFVQILTKISK